MKIGLIAGYGKMVDIVSSALEKEGHEIVFINIAKDREAEGVSNETHLYLENLEDFLTFLKKNAITHIAFAGKIDKTKIINNFSSSFEDKYQNIDKGDLNLLIAFQTLLKNYGIEIVNLSKYLKNYITEKKLYTNTPLSNKEEEDLYFGAKRIKILADMEIGQTMVLRDKMIYAVEAVEGTNECIRRAGALGAKGGIVIKVGRTSQRFDMEIPVIGFETVKVASESGMRIVAIESGRTLFIERNKAISFANEMGIKIVGFSIEGEI